MEARKAKIHARLLLVGDVERGQSHHSQRNMEYTK